MNQHNPYIQQPPMPMAPNGSMQQPSMSQEGGMRMPQQPMQQEGGIPMHAPMPPMPNSRRARWNKRLMSGAAASITSLPKWFATYAVGSYAVALFGVNLIFPSYAMEWYFWLFGIAWVTGSFFLSVHFSQTWSLLHVRKHKTFEKKIFWTGFLIRVIYAIFIYFFYLKMTGKAYEFQAADSWSYVEEVAADWSIYLDEGVFWNRFLDYTKDSFSDSGYPLAILLPVHWFGIDAALVLIRIIQAAFGAYTSVIIYRLARRSMDETTARIAGVFCMLHPVLICYVGMTLKEVLMTFLLVVFVDMADRMLRGRRYTFMTIAPMVLLGGLLFMFRTVLGLVAFMAVFFALIMMDTRIVSYGKKIILGVVLMSVLSFSVSDNVMREIDKIRQTDVMGQQHISMTKRYGTEAKKKTGNSFAKYAGAAVFAPLIFTIPFPTMVRPFEGQEDMRLIHGGNWMRNVMSGFVILAMFMLLLSGDWRKYTLALAMLLGYLVMLVFTEFAHSLRFHIPVAPFEMMFAAYAITNMRKKHRVWYMVWCIIMIVACFGWNWFKLAGRGLL